jgi:GNAT superfamily N-acetyltransferase
MIKFRTATVSDLSIIVHIIADDILGSKREDEANISPYIAAFNDIMKNNDNHLFVMLNENKIIGTFQIIITAHLPLMGAKRATIESVHIDSSFRGKGYGTKMMEYAIQIAKENGAKIVQLTTNKQRVDAKRFYEKLGFIASHEGMKLDIS